MKETSGVLLMFCFLIQVCSVCETSSSWKIMFCALWFMCSHKSFQKKSTYVYIVGLLHYTFEDIEVPVCMQYFCPAFLLKHQGITNNKEIDSLSLVGLGSFLGLPTCWQKVPLSEGRDEEDLWWQSKHPFKKKRLALRGDSRHVDVA